MIQQKIELLFGMHEGKLLHVSEVVRGLECACECPACGARLVAKKGASRHHHFAHASGADCPEATETALHLAAKSVLEQRREIILPAVQVEFSGPKPSILLAPEGRYVIDEVLLERSLGSVVPDVLATIRGKTVAIEVHVTHQVDSLKLARLQKLGLSTVEIDLSRAARDLSLRDIELLVVEGGDHKRWVYNAAAEKNRSEIRNTGRLLHTIRRDLALHVDGCPIKARTYKGKSYANVIDDCNGCEHAIEIGSDTSSVLCGGFGRAHHAINDA